MAAIALESLEIIISANVEQVEKQLQRIAPLIDKVLNSASKNVNNGVKNIEKQFNFKNLANETSKQMNKINKEALNFSKNLQTTFKDLEEKKVNIKTDEAKNKMKQLTQAMKEVANTPIGDKSDAFDRKTKKVAILTQQIQGLNKELGKQREKLEVEFENIPKAILTIEEKIKLNDNRIELLQLQIDQLKATHQSQLGKDYAPDGTIIDVETEASLKTLDTLQKKKELTEKLLDTSDGYVESLEVARTRSEELKESLEGVNNAANLPSLKIEEQILRKQNEVVKLEESIAKMTTGTINYGKSVDEATKSVVKLAREKNSLAKRSKVLFQMMTTPFKTLNSLLKTTTVAIKEKISLLRRLGTTARNIFRGAEKETGRFQKGLIASRRELHLLARRFFLFGVVLGLIRRLTTGLWNALRTNDQFAASLNQIQVNLRTAFFPIFNAALPAINALARALSIATGYLASFIALLFGMTFSSARDGAEGLQNAIDNLDGAGAAAGGANDKVKELRRTLMGFDEINRLNLDDDSDSGGADDGGGLNWNTEDFGIKQWMLDLQELMRDFFEPFKRAWETHGQTVIDAWQHALTEVKALMRAVGSSFMEVWTNGTGEEFIGNILLLVANVLNIVGDIAKAFRLAWEEAGRGTALIQSIFDALNAILELTNAVGDAFRVAWNDGTGVAIAANIFEIFTNIYRTIGNLAVGLKEAWNNNAAGERILSSILLIINDVLTHINKATQATAKWAEEFNFIPILESIARTLEALRPLIDTLIGNAIRLSGTFLGIVGDIGKAFGIAWEDAGRGIPLIQTFFGALSAILDLVNTIGISFRNAWNDGNGVAIATSIFDIFTNIVRIVRNLATNLKEAWNNNAVGERILSTILIIINNVLTRINNMAEATSRWARELNFTPMLESVANLLERLRPLTDKLGAGLEWFYVNVLLPLGSFVIERAIPVFLDALAVVIGIAGGVIEKTAPAFKEFFEVILKPLAAWAGDKLIKGLEWATENVDKLSHAFENLIIVFGLVKGISGIAGLITAFGKLAGVTGIGKVLGGLGKIVLGVGAKGGVGVLGAFGKLLLAAGPTGWLIAGLAAGITGLVALVWKNRDKIKEALDTAVNNIKEWGTRMGKRIVEGFDERRAKFKTAVGETIDTIKEKFNEKKDQIFTWGTNVGNKIKEGLSNTRTNIKTTAGDITDSIKGKFETAKNNATAWGSNIGNKVRSGLNSTRTNIKTTAGDITDSIKTKFTNLKSQAHGWGTSIGNGVSSGLNSVKNSIITTAGNIAGSISSKFKNVLGIASPSKVMKQLAIFTGQGFLEGLPTYFEKSVNLLGEYGEKMVDNFSGIGDELKDAIDKSELEFGNQKLEMPVVFTTQGIESMGVTNREASQGSSSNLADAVTQAVTVALQSLNIGGGDLKVVVALDGKEIGNTAIKEINKQTRQTGMNPVLSF